MASSNIRIQTSPQSVPSTPSWLGEVTIVAHFLTRLGLLEKLAERVRFARARFGIYDTIDFVVVLIGYSLSGEPTLKTFYERLLPFATPFMALFGRDQLPDRSVLSRFLKAIDQPTVEALRQFFQEDLVARTLTSEDCEKAGLQDRCGDLWKVFDVDATRQAARQRALPHTSDLPPVHRRMDAGLSLLDILDANGARWFVPAPPFCWLTPISGSARSAGLATEITEENCFGQSRS
jgi:hypothetical protein